MSFQFERDHSEIHSRITDSINYKHLREFYLRFNSRGIYVNQIANKTCFKTIETDLNSSSSLAMLACNNILNSNDDNYIKYTIDIVPKNLYKLFLKCALYTMNDFVIHILLEKWPFETLELGDYFKEAYSVLLFYYNTDINSYTGKLAPEILKWFLIGSKYTKLITKLFFKNQKIDNYKLKRLDLTGLPVSDVLLKKLFSKYIQCLNGNYDDSSASDGSFELFSSSSDLTSDESIDESYSSYSDIEDSDMETDDFSGSSDSSFDSIDFGHIDNKDDSQNLKGIKCQIKLDVILYNQSLLEKFMKIYNAKYVNNNNGETTGLELIFNKLDLTIRTQKYCVINDLIDKEALGITSLGIFFNASYNETQYTFNLIKKFKNIQELNVSGFGRDSLLNSILDNSDILENFKNSLGELKQLRRLRICIPGLKNKLGIILESLHQPLEYLNLTSCGLTETDLTFLSESKHVNTINNLVLSNNDLNGQIDQVIRLVKKMKSNLQVLDLGCNSFTYENYYRIINEGITRLDSLRMLITLDVFKFDNYLKIADRLGLMKHILSWRINYSSDYYEKSVKIKNKYKFRKFKNDYIEALEKRFLVNMPDKVVKITINDPDLNYILNEVF